ncbi:MAG: crossover junction endodeoxyribonuclease RuvC [Omnitrophica WOR_2 bacterium GWF2_43_52]|nr:MAG: crossover junction endodeoxyribonuclease RuvC [Omnitrophica WOR_2 bacterium GWA2_44_7]OGX17031.1 MAG: crossover junction endodeoxyribonuclease RuvC [Omnitrophica WOR_2 bacterium GWC2_44_8]OGX20997.1 MAG: crossover junction endodeoxyribonuclease RuvC [Omnitrophica WOR_2 bacterium GWF2_43_52]OGX56834.1 MAG: crossover junction endodeoxyribonuclease RuvC [Omnitrophica WOR_2 bacterium RIFOXYC2_FULL_43_9]HAH21176.1 crossover junction endodeoxyribonuclease RuvC [Candidatus Omnitrophota bacteri
MRILGIDPGLHTSGYGVVEGRGLKISLIEAGYIRTNPKEETESRLEHIHKAIEKIIRKFKPEVLVLEKLYAHWKHPTTAYVLGHARGIICLSAKENNVAVFEYAATRIKKAIVGKGHASKLQIQRMIQGLLKLAVLPEPADVADALALAIGHSYMTRK